MNAKSLIQKIIAISMLLVSMLAAQTIEPGRGVKITIAGVPTEDIGMINNVYPVSDAGTVRLYLIKEIRIAGLNSNDAAKKIEDAYKSQGYYTMPVVQVTSESSETINQAFITVTGAVNKSGPVVFQPKITLFQAVALAGDVNMFGDKSKVTLMRGASQRVYNLNNPNDRSIELRPNDAVIVRERGWLPKFGND